MSHYTLLHIESKSDTSTHSSNTIDESVSSNAAAGPMSNYVLMTCCVLAYSPDGSTVKASFCISPTHNLTRKLHVTAIIVPKVTCNLPISSIYSDHDWKHLSGIPLADANFDSPGKVDILLGVDIFVEVIH